MFSTARAVVAFSLVLLPLGALAQTGPSDPQLISAAPTAKISLGQRKLGGHLTATVRVNAEGRVGEEVLVTENTTDGLEEQLVKVLRSARFRPALDDSGRPVEGNADLKVELRQSTGNAPKPTHAKSDPQQTEKEKARIRRMKCSDFLWEWELLREEADDAAATEFMPRIATAMYASLRTEAGDYVDAKVWKSSARSLREAAERCEEARDQLFWQDTFKPIMDAEVPK